METQVSWWGVEEALKTRGTAVHIGLRSGWSSCVRQGEVIRVGSVRATVVSRLNKATWEDFSEMWRSEHQGDIPDPVTTSNYGLFAVRLMRVD